MVSRLTITSHMPLICISTSFAGTDHSWTVSDPPGLTAEIEGCRNLPLKYGGYTDIYEGDWSSPDEPKKVLYSSLQIAHLTPSKLIQIVAKDLRICTDGRNGDEKVERVRCTSLSANDP